MKKYAKRLVIVSNRLPFSLVKENKEWRVKPGTGGLVTALAPVLRDRGGLWVGWPGTQTREDLRKPLKAAVQDAGYSMIPVMLGHDEVQKYYVGLSNEVIWPLFHDLQSLCNFSPPYWETYNRINRRFAEVTFEHSNEKDFIWVHDYHLINVARELRDLGLRSRIGFFLHIPFPPPDIFMKLPWRLEILQGLLAYDLIGFQTLRDSRNFIQCLRSLVKEISSKRKGHLSSITFKKRKILVGSFPISIDFNEFEQLARSQEVADRAWYIHEDLPMGKIVLGIDRLDYTKGLLYRIKSFRTLLRKHPELHRRVTLIQVVVPSRRNIPMYRDLKIEIERLVSEVNGEFTRSGWVPIHYIYRSLQRAELLAYYRTSEIALITPLKDGMNLVAKEYCASNIEESGTLILSEFAGAASQLHRGAIMVNPYNIEEVADAIHQAYKMNREERKERMRKMRQSIRKYDIFWWVNSYLEAAIAGKLDNFPLLEDSPRLYLSSVSMQAKDSTGPDKRR
jgi:trehalose 6-phosphate synthase